MEKTGMCKVISSDSIIGNYVIESIENNDFQIELQKLYDFDKKLSEELEKHNYYTNFDLKKVMDFKDNYPFLVESINDESFKIIDTKEKNDELCWLLKRYFRLGMPKIVINNMTKIFKLVLE